MGTENGGKTECRDVEGKISRLKLLELVLLAAFIVFGTYMNAKEVPAVKNELFDQKLKLAVLETQFTGVKDDMKEIRGDLKEIKRMLGGRRRGAGNGSSDD